MLDKTDLYYALCICVFID